jgi:hypothetical protein
MYGSPQKDLNLPIPTSPYGHRKEDPDLMHQQQHARTAGAGHMSSGLLRYRSAPSTLLGEVCEDFIPTHARTSSPETDSMLARFLGADLRHSIPDPKPAMNLSPPTTAAPGSHFASAVVENHQHNPHPNPHQMMFQSHQQHVPSHNSVESLYRTVSSAALETDQIKAGAAGSTASANIMRTTSSPAGFFANLNVENGIITSHAFIIPLLNSLSVFL